MTSDFQHEGSHIPFLLILLTRTLFPSICIPATIRISLHDPPLNDELGFPCVRDRHFLNERGGRKIIWARNEQRETKLHRLILHLWRSGIYKTLTDRPFASQGKTAKAVLIKVAGIIG